MNQQIAKATSSIKPALSLVFALSYVFSFGAYLYAPAGQQSTVAYAVSFKSPTAAALTGTMAARTPAGAEALQVATAKVPGTCDLLKNTACNPAAWLKAVVANLLA